MCAPNPRSENCILSILATGRCSLPVHCIRKRLELYLPLLGLGRAAGVDAMLNQFSPDHAIAFIARLLARHGRNHAAEIVRHAVYGLGVEVQTIALERGFIEELVDELVLVALRVAETRDVAGQPAILDRELYELPFTKKG